MHQDPLRQKMLFRTEWKTIGVQGGNPQNLADQMNSAFRELLSDGYNVSQLLPTGDTLTKGGPGMLIVGQRVSSPANDPTPEGVPVPGTAAHQSIEVIYSYALSGEMKTTVMPTLQAAVAQAAKDLAQSAIGLEPSAQPISIHVTSITAYGPGDLHVLRERFR